MTLICGYFMACKNVLLQKPIVMFVLFTMYFNGGMIPTYLNIRDLGLYNTLAALIIPGCLSVYNAIITRTAIEAIPESLTESARLDGAGELTIIFKIILPLLKPNIAVLLCTMVSVTGTAGFRHPSILRTMICCRFRIFCVRY